MTNKYTVIRDTREQENHGWVFAPSVNCEATLDEKLPTGDYTLRGYENKFVIERKNGVAEFAKNIFEARFEAELVRLESFEFPFIILEFNMGHILSFPIGSGIPKSIWPTLRVNKYYILKKFIEYQVKYKTKIILAGEGGKDVASSLFKRIVEHYG